MEMIGLDSLGSMLVTAPLHKQLMVAAAPSSSSIKEHGNSPREFAQHIKTMRGYRRIPQASPFTCRELLQKLKKLQTF